MHPCAKEDQQRPVLYQEDKRQQVEGGDPIVLLSTGKATSGVLDPVLDVCNELDWMTIVYRGVSEPYNS